MIDFQTSVLFSVKNIRYCHCICNGKLYW